MTDRSPAYRLDELGWTQFERLCTELLALRGIAPDRWSGRADELRLAAVEDGIELVPGRPAPGPALVAVWWLAPAVSVEMAGSRLTTGRLEEELRGPSRPASVVLVTNAPLRGEERASLAGLLEALAGARLLQVIGPAELGPLLDGEPAVRRRVPSVLGVRELEGLVSRELLERSSGDVEAARALAPVFVPTRAYGQALRVLERHRFAVLTGPPEMGKTAIARMLGLALLTEGWELHECVRPDELWARYDRGRAQLFVADDAFGSTEYRPEAAERWALDLDRVLRATDERHWLVWTSRPAPLKAALARIHREHGVERWPQPAEVQVAAAELDVEEKASILFRHARAAPVAQAARALVRRHGWEIVSHRHFTPERIRRFVAGRLIERAGELDERALAHAVEAEIREPTEAMAASLRALPAEHRALLVALLDAPPGPVSERDLAAAARLHGEAGLPKPPGELVDRLTDHFLRVVPPLSVTWVHPSWRDLVIDELAADAAARNRFLERCSLDGLLLALSVGGGAAGERTLPLLVDDADWDTLAARLRRLAGDLDDTDLVRLLFALAAALDADAEGRRRAELDALATELLDALARAWDGKRAARAVSVLEAYAAVYAALEEPPPFPDVGATWVELLPTGRIDLEAADELARLDDWLRLVAVLRAAAPSVAAELGFPARQEEVLRRFVADAADATLSAPPATGPLLADCLRRLADVAPEVAGGARTIASRFRAPDESVAAVDPLRTPLPRAPAAIVDRILRDLER